MTDFQFKNYYYLIGISNDASEEEIKTAIDKLEGKRSKALLYEIRMVLLNKELRKVYDIEYEMYSKSDAKQDYIIKNDELKNFLESIRQQEEVSVHFTTEKIVKEAEKNERYKKLLLGIIIAITLFLIKKCVIDSIVSTNLY